MTIASEFESDNVSICRNALQNQIQLFVLFILKGRILFYVSVSNCCAFCAFYMLIHIVRTEISEYLHIYIYIGKKLLTQFAIKYRCVSTYLSFLSNARYYCLKFL